ncbi:MAG: N-acetyltransferase family protein, partial [Halalkalicoccus sp.]
MTAQLRPATAGDAAAVARIYAPFVSESVVSFEVEPPAEAEMAARIAQKTVRYPWLVCDLDGVVGYASAGAHRDREAYRWSVDVSVYVDPAHHRRGIARALYTALFALVRNQGFVTAYAGIA